MCKSLLFCSQEDLPLFLTKTIFEVYLLLFFSENVSLNTTYSTNIQFL